MPRLKFVNLSFNELSTPINKIDLCWDQLRNLVLNSTFIRWQSIQEILGHLPQLEELHLSLNGYKHVHLSSEEEACACQADEPASDAPRCCCPQFDYRGQHSHPKLRKLHFTGNPVRQWWQVCKLGYAFPNLESLVLANCPIDSLKTADEGCSCERIGPEGPEDAFKKLVVLNLNSTELSRWGDVEILAKFPALSCVRVQVSARSWSEDLFVAKHLFRHSSLCIFFHALCFTVFAFLNESIHFLS